MLTATATSTITTDSSSKTPRVGLLARLLASKKLPAQACFGVLLILCAVLVAALLVYVLLSLVDKGHAVASPPSVTPDGDADGHDHAGESAAKNGSTDTATATDGALSIVAVRERRHTDAFRSVSSSVPSPAGDSTGFTTGPPDSDVSTDAAIGINGDHDEARTNANRSSVEGEIALIEALIGLEASSDTATLPDPFDNDTRTAIFANKESPDITSAAAWQDDFVVFRGQQETMPNLETPAYSNESTREVIGRHTSAQQKAGTAENSTRSKYTATSDVATNCNASTSALSNASERVHFRFGMKGAHTRPVSHAAHLNYSIHLSESKTDEQPQAASEAATLMQDKSGSA